MKFTHKFHSRCKEEKLCTSKNFVYFEMPDSQQSKINCSAWSSISGYLMSFLEFIVFDAAAAI